MKEYIVNSQKGINDIFFGMTLSEVKGRIDATKCQKTLSECVLLLEDQNDMKFLFENDKLVCIISLIFPSTPRRIILGGDKIPYDLMGAVKFLKDKSKRFIRFSHSLLYVFADFGIVLYPLEIHDIPAGMKSIENNQQLAICNTEITKRYYKLGLKMTGKSDD